MADDPHAPERKVALRAEVLAARSRRSESQRVAAAAQLARRAVAHLATPRVVAAYLSFGTEPPTGELIASLVERGIEVAVPVVDGEELDWVHFDPGDTATAGPLGMPEPAGPRLGVDYVAGVDAVLVPALAADMQGNRLGRGRGYYDRALASMSSLTVAVVYDDELLDAVPIEPHDRPVSAVLTPSAWFDVAGR